jgi:hypothetical protein
MEPLALYYIYYYFLAYKNSRVLTNNSQYEIPITTTRQRDNYLYLGDLAGYEAHLRWFTVAAGVKTRLDMSATVRAGLMADLPQKDFYIFS